MEEQHQIEKLLQQGLWRVKFPAAIENDYRIYYQKTFAKLMRYALITSLLVIFASSYFDFFYLYNYSEPIIIKFAIAAPLIAILIGISYTTYFEKYGQQVMVLSICVLAFMIFATAFYYPGQVKILFYGAGVLLLEFYAFAVTRIRFFNSLICAIFIVIVANIIFYLDTISNRFLIDSYNFMYVSAAVLALLANYQISVILRRNYLNERLIQIKNSVYSELAYIDTLTNISNRRGFDNALASEFKRAKRHQYYICLMIIDVDCFKEYNDNYGHQKGDEILALVADKIKRLAKRDDDFAGRYGGDEFVLLLSNPSEEYIREIAYKLQAEVNALNIKHDYSKFCKHVSITIGVAALIPKPEDHQQILFQKADDALYRAKDSGRNCVVFDI